MTNESRQVAAADPDDLQPAREIRRALAKAGFKARDVGLVAVWATGPRARERAEHSVVRGLGRFAGNVVTIFDDPNVAARCQAAVERGDVAVAVALTIDPVGGGVASAFGRRR